MRINVALALCALFFLSGNISVFGAKSGKVLRGSVDQWSTVCNAAGIKLTGANVDKVMLGTPAYFSGLRAKDRILNCDVENSTLKVTFERDGKRYGVTIATHPAAIQPSGVVETPSIRTAVSEQQALDQLKNFDVILFVDCSGSMDDLIRSEHDIRKWDWARERVKEFNAKYQQVSKRPITLVMFNSDFKIQQNCTMSDVEKVFRDRRPDGGTDLAKPLEEIVRQRLYAPAKRPCVVAILHDGITDDENAVRKILEDASRKLSFKDQLRITFLQIGDDAFGATAMQEWDKSDIGTHDFVKAELFQDVKKEGLARAIAQVLSK